MISKQYLILLTVVDKGYTALGLWISKKSGDCGWNLANVATGKETFSTWTIPPSSSNRLLII